MNIPNGFAEESMNLERNRLFTFKAWPSSAPISAERLAKAGFYYTGKGFEVICFSCNGKLREWLYGDQAFEKHRKSFPSCKFVLGKSNNEPFIPGRCTFSLYESSCPEKVNDNQSKSLPVCINSCDLSQSNNLCHEHLNTPAPSFQCNIFPTSPNIKHLDKSVTVNLRRECDRLDTFTNWPVSYINKYLLSAAGFYYFGYEDKVQCAFCGGILGMWEPNDIPIEEHRKHFPFCHFLQGMDVGNVPLQDCCAREERCLDVPVLNMSEDLWYDETGSVPFEQLGIVSSIPKHPSYSTYERRLATFNKWPRYESRQIPEQLAEAGFIYAGFSDNVKCFFCDGGLRNWLPNDDPWTEHARWFSTCGFLRLTKGEQFIAEVLRSFPNDNQFTLPSASPQHRPPILVSRSQSISQNFCPHHLSQLDQEMTSPIVQSVLGLGFDISDVRKAVETKLRLTGCGFNLAENLVGSLLESNRSIPASQEASASAMPSSPLSSLQPHGSVPFQSSKPPTSPSFGMKTSPKPSSPSSPLSLEEEYHMLKDQRTCKICMDNEVGVVFLPCGHLISCVQCAPALRDCPICRRVIRGTVRIYLS